MRAELHAFGVGQHFAEELADVVGYSLALANELGLDLSSAIRAKNPPTTHARATS